ncbi:MAG: small-conductance mechanosensitive channel [Actinobacteria bacterium]|nr:small-conductance mechanosensitive channel [Actinomycetota bacterium]
MSTYSSQFHAEVTTAAAGKSSKLWDWFSGAPLHIIVIFFIAVIAQRLGSRTISRAMNRLATVDLVHGQATGTARQKERANTTGTLLISTLNAVIWVIALGMILGEFGLNLGPLIASAGVIGIAFGLGALEKVGLRITTVRDDAGTLWYLRNGEILKVGNRSKKK